MQVGARPAQRRKQSEQHTREGRHGQREAQHTAIERDGIGAEEIDLPRYGAHQRRHSPTSQRYAQRPTQHTQQNAFGEQLTDEAPPSGAQRGANRHLLFARHCPRQQDTARIHTRDGQHQPHGSQQHHQAAPGLRLCPPGVEAEERGRPPRLTGLVVLQPLRHGIHPLLRLIQRNVRPQARDDPRVQFLRYHGVMRQRKGNPEISAGLRKPEIGRHHTRHYEFFFIEDHRPAENCGIGAVDLAPHRIAQHDRVVPVGPAVVRHQQSAQLRAHAEEGHQAAADVRALQHPRFGLAGERHGNRLIALEPFHEIGAAPLIQGVERQAGVGDFLSWVGVPDFHQAIRMRIRQGPQQHRVHHGVDRSGGADSEHDGEQRRQGERGLFRQHPDAENKILQECRHSPR